MFCGDRLKKKRLELNLSQEDFGAKIGVSKVTISGYENGTRTPKMDHFLKIVEILAVTPDYLLGRDIQVVGEDEVPYIGKKISKEELQVLSAIQKYPKLSMQLRSEPERTVELIHRKLYK